MLYNGTEQSYGFFICLFYDKESDPLIAHALLSNFTALFTASYRIGNDFSFDEKMAEYGCNVFSFDPTMDKEDHRHSPGVMFYNLGLSDVDQERPRHPRPWYKFDKMKWKTRTFKGGVWLHFEPKFVTDCKAHKTPAILCIFIEFFMQIDQPTV